ncbi:uncharacterized protein DUF4124 [Panacagrimonas perspica]|uniref:Uncharacterized protein DUF4124 n=1 Tax=Panacagrimonas perspica TaxID=381431 RepID=A0A4S3JZ64_9GAMM|nr:DUF4124 domain-containing protein [Panacagrimonas perspica]TDU28495.1 uncharacterized protein DUF4124 [Panacagrimonas perspica]THD00893.1 hypothetical protein B1810_22605 [Panacagrimonas perspica]
MRVLLTFVSLIAAGTAQAQVYKCTDDAGRKHYQDQPCNDSQRATPYDPRAGNVTTIDSETSRRETLGALVTREETRRQHIEVTTPKDSNAQVILSQPGPASYPYDDGVAAYPVHPYERGGDRRGHDRHDDRGPRVPRRPDETPMIDPPRGSSSYVPKPPTVRQVAPRSPMPTPSSSSGSRRPSTQGGASRSDDR